MRWLLLATVILLGAAVLRAQHRDTCDPRSALPWLTCPKG